MTLYHCSSTSASSSLQKRSKEVKYIESGKTTASCKGVRLENSESQMLVTAEPIFKMQVLSINSILFETLNEPILFKVALMNLESPKTTPKCKAVRSVPLILFAVKSGPLVVLF
eukprot:Lithocolla_globosa_v1_NODE_45_length_8054_cov_9.461981.p5 type:complete len:114 gc:universal NODE_45_length_8054_cov_9.461981:3237-3578(+)